jgi:uracil-DNA glycosylase
MSSPAELKHNPWYGTRGSRNARCLVIGEAWGESEAAREKAFVGSSGQELDRILGDAGIPLDACLFTNIRPERPTNNKMEYFFLANEEVKSWGQMAPTRGLYPDPVTLFSLSRLYDLVHLVSPQVIIGCGNYPAWAMTTNAFRVKSKAPEKGAPTRKSPTGITSWRGSQLHANVLSQSRQIPFVPIIHPAAIGREWSWRQPTVHDLRTRVKPILDGKPWRVRPNRFIVRPSFRLAGEILDFLSILPPGSTIAEDTECRSGFMSCIGLAWSPFDAISIPLQCVENPNGYWSPSEEANLRCKLSRLHLRKDLSFIFQNAAWDFQYLDSEFIPLPLNVRDTMLSHHLLFPGTPKGLDFLSSMYCENHVYWKDDGKLWNESIPETVHWNYNCEDAARTWEIDSVLVSTIKAQKMEVLARERIDQLFLAHDMVRRGVEIDTAEMGKQRIQVFAQRGEREQFLSKVLSEDLSHSIRGKSAKAPWYYSPTQQMKLFYDELSFPERIDRHSKARTIDDEALRKIEQIEPLLQPITRTIRELRSLTVYYNNILSMVLDPDGRARSSYGVAGANTFRWNSQANAFGRGTNLMNVPKGVDKE